MTNSYIPTPEMIDQAVAMLEHIKRTANEVSEQDSVPFPLAVAISVTDILPDDYPLDALDAAVALIGQQPD